MCKSRAGAVREPEFREQFDPSRPLETPTGIADPAQALAALKDAADQLPAYVGKRLLPALRDRADVEKQTQRRNLLTR